MTISTSAAFLSYIKVRFKGITFHGHVFLMFSYDHTVYTAHQIPTVTSNSRCLCQRVRFGG